MCWPGLSSHLSLISYKVRRSRWHPTPVLLPGESHGQRSLVAVVHGVAKSRTQLSDFTFTFHFHALEKEVATHSSVLAWRIPGTGEPGGLLSVGLHRVGHDWSDLAAAAAAALTKLISEIQLFLISLFLCVFYFMNFCPYFFLYIFFGFILLFLKKNTTSWDWFLVYFFIFCDICIYKAFDYLPKHCFNFSWICIFIFKCLLWFLLWHELL